MQTAIGHWGETMFPLFSILKREASFAWPPAQFVLLHLKRVCGQPPDLSCDAMFSKETHFRQVVPIPMDKFRQLGADNAPAAQWTMHEVPGKTGSSL